MTEYKHRLEWKLPPHRQLEALTLADDGSLLSDSSQMNGTMTAGDIRYLIRSFERTYQKLGEMALEN